MGDLLSATISKRMGDNLRGEYKRKKNDMLSQILDDLMEAKATDEELNKKRLQLEVELEKIMEAEEMYWQQRGGEKWTLEGDTNSSFFFHLVANGRKRKKTILSLEHEGVNVTEPRSIQSIIYDYYKNLFRMRPNGKVKLGTGAWSAGRRLNSEDNVELTKPFF